MYYQLLRHYRFYAYKWGDITLMFCRFALGIELTEFGFMLLIGPLELLIYWPKFWGGLL